MFETVRSFAMVTLPVSLSTSTKSVVPSVILKSPDVESIVIITSPVPVGFSSISSFAPAVIKPPETVMPVVVPSEESTVKKSLASWPSSLSAFIAYATAVRRCLGVISPSDSTSTEYQ